MKLLGFVSIVALTSVPALASANEGTSGYSGKPYNGNTQSCDSCHSGGTAPTITITGPATLTAGASQQYTIKVAGGSGYTAINAAMTDGVIVTAGTNLEVAFPQNAELSTVNAPVAGNTGTYTFTVKGPPTNGPIELWVAGMAANKNGANTGDGVAKATKDITVTGGTDGPPPSPDAGTSGTSGTSGSTDPRPDDGKTNPRPDGGTGTNSNPDGGTSTGNGDNSGDDGTGYEDDAPVAKKSSGCALGDPTGIAGAGGLWLVMGACLAYIRRRRSA